MGVISQLYNYVLAGGPWKTVFPDGSTFLFFEKESLIRSFFMIFYDLPSRVRIGASK